MPLTLMVETDGGMSEFVMKPVDRKSRQAIRKRIPVDAQGRGCRLALMTHEGLLLAPGTVAGVYEDADGNSLDRGDVYQTDAQGNVLRNLPATLGRPQRPVGQVPIEEILEHVVEKAYALAPVSMAGDLADALADGAVFRVACRARATTVELPAYVCANHSGLFLLQCRPCLAQFIRREQVVIMENEWEEDEDAWDEWQQEAEMNTSGDEAW